MNSQQIVDGMLNRAMGKITKAIAANEDGLRIVYNENSYNDSEWVEFIKSLKMEVFKRNLNKNYNFWTDGCNFASEDYVHMMKKSIPDTQKGGWCWASPFWTDPRETVGMSTCGEPTVIAKNLN